MLPRPLPAQVPEESPNKLFVGGLPCEWPEQAVRLILEPWGAIKAFNLVMDKATGNSKVRRTAFLPFPWMTDGIAEHEHPETLPVAPARLPRAASS